MIPVSETASTMSIITDVSISIDSICDQLKQLVAQKDNHISELTVRLSVSHQDEEISRLRSENAKLLSQIGELNIPITDDSFNSLDFELKEAIADTDRLTSTAYELSAEYRVQLDEKDQKITELQNKLDQLTLQCQTYQQTIADFQNKPNQLMTHCQEQEKTILQLRSQLSGFEDLTTRYKSQEQSTNELNTKLQNYERTITDLTVHFNFTTWLQQNQAALMGQLLNLYQQAQKQPQPQPQPKTG